MFDVLYRFVERWRAASSLEEERAIFDDSNPMDTSKDGDNIEPDYTPPEHPSELLSSKYEPDEDEDDTTTSIETSPPCPTPFHWSYMTPVGTWVKHTLRKAAVTSSWKRAASLPASPLPAKKSRGDSI
ncbi:unnamed protein product [Lactuca saligna]|uniref:Uncharacterized protein n=1 Tax=Lactuca saligna TaxID=75948 RepID=A0AA35ZCE0_LACSI|nr:unnamed protein product [Lactuca saligna]